MGEQSVAEIIRYSIDLDQTPPLYSILLHFWIKLGGNNEGWIRSLSALFGVLTVAVIYLLGKTYSDERVGLLAALLLSLSPFHIQLAQEARGYTMLVLTACASIWCTAQLLRLRTTDFPDMSDSGSGKSAKKQKVNLNVLLSWAGYVFFTALALYSHNTAALLPMALNIFVIGLWLFQYFFPERVGLLKAPRLRYWLLAQLGVLILWGPWLPGLYLQSSGMNGGFWIQAPTPTIVLDTLKTLILAWLPERIAWRWLVWLLYGGLFTLALVKYRKMPSGFIFPLIIFLTPFIGELLISVWQPVFYDRTLIWASIPLLLLIAEGIIQLHFKEYIRTAAIILVTLSCLSAIDYYSYSQKEPWNVAAEYVEKNVQPEDIILFNAGWCQIPFDYYFDSNHSDIEQYGLPVTLFARGELEPRMMPEDLTYLHDLVIERNRVWLVYSHNWWTDPQGLIPKALERDMDLETSRLFQGIQVQLYSK